jgi:transposase InsO family protein
LAAYDVRHILTLPAHPWTNGRCERVWRTFCETLRRHFWLIASRRQLIRICADFMLWYDRDRPHAAWSGHTPNEVYFGRIQRPVTHAIERITYFDGRIPWFRFG